MAPKPKKWFYDYKTLHKITGVALYQLRHCSSRGIFDASDLFSVVLYIAGRSTPDTKAKINEALSTDSEAVACTIDIARKRYEAFLEPKEEAR